MGNQTAADVRHHGAGRDRRHRARHDADHPDPHAHSHAGYQQAGIDPVYFGVLFIINNSIGLITPPVGVVLNVVCGVSRISMEDIIKGVWPFMIAQLIVLFLMVLFPALVTVPANGSEVEMQTAIATVCLSGVLNEKLEAIAAAGFKGVEMFENDLLSFNGTPADVRRMIEGLGLRTITFQPFRDFEGMPAERRARVFQRAERKFDLMQELGCDP